MGGLFKKICKEISRPFRQSSRSLGRLARNIGGEKFGNFIERALNVITDTVAICGAGIFGGPAGVAAATAMLSASQNLSDKDIFKAAIIGGASSFVTILSSQIVAANGLGLTTVATNAVMNGTISAASGQNVLKGVAYGFGGLIAPNNPLLVATMKTIAEKDIEAGLLHVVGVETGQYLQAYVNTTKHIDDHVEKEKIIISKSKNDKILTKNINKSIQKDADLYKFVRDEMIEPYKESMKVDHLPAVKEQFEKTYEKINTSMWKLKTSMTDKTNELNVQVIDKIRPDYGQIISSDINGVPRIGIKTDDWALSTGLSSIYPRGFVVKYDVINDATPMIDLTENNFSLEKTSHTFSEQVNRGTCYTSKSYNTIKHDSAKATIEYHANVDCIIASGAIATVAVLVPPSIPYMAWLVAIPVAANADTSIDYTPTKISNNIQLAEKIMESHRCDLLGCP